MENKEQTTMSVAKALMEVALINKRLNALKDSLPSRMITAVTVGEDKDKVIYVGKEARSPGSDDQAALVSNFQSVMSLMSYRDALRNAIILSNAMTTIQFQDIDYTIAELIEMRKNLAFYKSLDTNIKNQVTVVRNLFSVLNTKFQQQVSAEQDKIPVSFTIEEATTYKKAIEESVGKKMRPQILDPNKLEQVAAQLSDRIDWIESEMELAINESNMKTQITVRTDIRPLVKISA